MNNSELIRAVMEHGDLLVRDSAGIPYPAMEYDRDVNGVARVDYVLVFNTYSNGLPQNYEYIEDSPYGPFTIVGKVMPL